MVFPRDVSSEQIAEWAQRDHGSKQLYQFRRFFAQNPNALPKLMEAAILLADAAQDSSDHDSKRAAIRGMERLVKEAHTILENSQHLDGLAQRDKSTAILKENKVAAAKWRDDAPLSTMLSVLVHSVGLGKNAFAVESGLDGHTLSKWTHCRGVYHCQKTPLTPQHLQTIFDTVEALGEKYAKLCGDEYKTLLDEDKKKLIRDKTAEIWPEEYKTAINPESVAIGAAGGNSKRLSPEQTVYKKR